MLSPSKVKARWTFSAVFALVSIYGTVELPFRLQGLFPRERPLANQFYCQAAQ